MRFQLSDQQALTLKNGTIIDKIKHNTPLSNFNIQHGTHKLKFC